MTKKHGLDLAVTGEYYDIILDVGLPYMENTTICETLRAKKNIIIKQSLTESV